MGHYFLDIQYEILYFLLFPRISRIINTEHISEGDGHVVICALTFFVYFSKSENRGQEKVGI